MGAGEEIFLLRAFRGLYSEAESEGGLVDPEIVKLTYFW